MDSKGIMTRAAIAFAILLFVINPAVHQHNRAAVPDCGSLSTVTSSAAACSVCMFQTNVAVETPAAAQEAPRVAHRFAPESLAIPDSEFAANVSSRAPPAFS